MSGTGLLCSCLSALSPSIDAGMGVGPVLSCGNDVGGVEPDELGEEEVVDNPGTTIGAEFSVLHCIRTPLLMRHWFPPLVQSDEYP